MNEQKNLIWAMILSAIVVMFYFAFLDPNTQRTQLENQELIAQQKAEAEKLLALQPPVEPKTREQLIAQGQATRIKIETPSMTGSFLTTGSRVDDLALKQYNATLDAEDGLVQLLNPEGAHQLCDVTKASWRCAH